LRSTPTAVPTWLFSDFSTPAAVGAGLKDFLDERSNLLTDTNLTLTTARVACFQHPALGARTIAGPAHLRQIDLNLLFAPQKDVVEFNGMTKKNVRASAGRTSSLPSTEKGRKEISTKNVLKIDVEAASAETSEGVSLGTVVTEPVVLSSLLIVGEHSIRFLNFFESVLCVVFRASVRMVFSGETTKRIFHFTAGGRLVNTQDFVIVSLVTHVGVLGGYDEGPDLNLTPRFYRSKPQCGQ
jgi:hypothetical protein